MEIAYVQIHSLLLVFLFVQHLQLFPLPVFHFYKIQESYRFHRCPAMLHVYLELLTKCVILTTSALTSVHMGIKYSFTYVIH